MTEPNDFVKRVLAEHEEMREMLQRIYMVRFQTHEWYAVNREIGALLDRLREVSDAVRP